jgi:hypothetical protein
LAVGPLDTGSGSDRTGVCGCGVFRSGEEAGEVVTPNEKLAYVEQQINGCMKMDITTIECPWCHSINSPDQEQLCCADMGLAVRAILRRQAQMECLDQCARVMETVEDMAARN